MFALRNLVFLATVVTFVGLLQTHAKARSTPEVGGSAQGGYGGHAGHAGQAGRAGTSGGGGMADR